MPYILVSLISVLDVVFILIRNKVKNEIGLVFKMLGSINFIIFAIICFILNKSSNINYSLYIFGGLSFGFIGDFLLGVRRIAKNKHLFLIGGSSFFLIGHFMYIGAITYLSSVNYFLLALFIFIFFGISVFIGFAFRFTFKNSNLDSYLMFLLPLYYWLYHFVYYYQSLMIINHIFLSL